jgi:hypothetical protein
MIDHTLEIAQAVHNAVRSSLETVTRLTAENAAQAVEIDRLRRENYRHRRQGLLRLAADLRQPEPLYVAALRAKREEGTSLPGHTLGRDWFENACRNGCTDEGA